MMPRVNIILPAKSALTRTWATISHTGTRLFQSPALQADADALFFSVKSFAAAMLAYYLSLRIGLPKPYWAILTVYLVSQPSAGASLGRGVYRLAGTMAGAVATVAIVPNFVNNPIICSVAIAGWIGLCLYFALLDRTPRAYAFVLAGYTASLIGFPSVFNPGAVFETASVRVQEISLGILCTILMHRFVLPKRMTGQFLGKLSATLRDARRLAGEVLLGGSGQQVRHACKKLAVDMLGLQGLATHLPYDPASAKPRAKDRRLLHARLARLLLLAPGIEDRVRALHSGDHAAPDELPALLREIERWIGDGDKIEKDGVAIQLIDRARSLRTRIAANAATPDERLAANLVRHLAEMLGLLHDCDRLERNITLGGRSRGAAAYQWPGRASGYVYHRDHWKAARAALGATVGIVVGCLVWIWSAWPDGAMAVSVLGVCCSLYGTVDEPAPHVIQYTVGTVYGVAMSLAYSFLILPRVTDFPVLVAVLAPAFLFAGSLQARFPTMNMGFGITLTIPILAGLGTTYTGDFAGSLNTIIALFASLAFGLVSMTLLQTVPVDTAINRLLRPSRKDVRRHALGKGNAAAHWTNLMVDRMALLLPKMRLSKNSYSDALNDPLHHLRVGYTVGQLRHAIRHVGGDIGETARELFSAIAAHFDTKRRTRPVEPIELAQRIEMLMVLITDSSIQDRSRLLDLLIDLQFALAPSGIPKEAGSL